MSFKLSDNGNKPVYGKVSYVADTRADVANVPITDAAGSTCFVIGDSSVFMLNTQKQWKEI